MNAVDTPVPVTELSPDASGTWQVVTRDSTHTFKMDEGPVTREPGPNARRSTIVDRPRLLRTLDTCRVGERGRWTMFTDDPSDPLEFHWASTSVVMRIERVSDGEPTEHAHAATA
jgi:hypothetical protein